MGRKVNPTILRITSISRVWDPHWFADRRPLFRDQLKADLLIREYLRTALRMASISRVEIMRDQKETVLTIHSSRPAVVIGRGGSGIEKIQKDLKKKLGGSRLRINVQEVRNPDTDAAAIATQVVDQLERRMPFRRILKQSISRAMQAGAVGVRIALAGRLNGAEIARNEWLSEGNVPLHTFRADVVFAEMTAFTTYGTIGIKVWINRGELVDKEVHEAPGKKVMARPHGSAPRRRSSLAEAAAAQRGSKQDKK